MKEDQLYKQDQKEIAKIKNINYVVLGIFAAIVVWFLLWLGSYRYWHTFTQEKWLEYPKRRSEMTADLLENYTLVGMSEDEIVALLGQHNNDFEYFN